MCIYCDTALEVVAGKWGNGVERKKRLEKAGFDFKIVQHIVNLFLVPGLCQGFCFLKNEPKDYNFPKNINKRNNNK